jgi:acetyl-CoA/propionyl-CoA carboxylase biotin carboxyl carrier protein
MEDPAFTENFSIYTSYIENEFKNDIPPFEQSALNSQTHAAAEHLVTEINGKRFEIFVHAPEPVHKRHRAKEGASGASTGTALTSPMQGTVVKVAVEEGQKVVAGELIFVVEAMKMEQPLNAHRDGIITNLSAIIGETVSSGSTLCDIIDA